MKRVFIAALMCLTAALSHAQTECSTAWPYLYPRFQEAEISLLNGSKITRTVNVHTLEGRLHYLENDVVKEMIASNVASMQIGEDRYIVIGLDIMKVMASDERGSVAAHILGDFDSLRESGGAYGSSTTSSATRKLTSLDLPGVNRNHMELWNNKQNGEIVNLKYEYWLVCPAYRGPATRKAIEDSLDEKGLDEFKTWRKSNKIKWNSPESLMQLLNFFEK